MLLPIDRASDGSRVPNKSSTMPKTISSSVIPMPNIMETIPRGSQAAKNDLRHQVSCRCGVAEQLNLGAARAYI